MKSTLLSVFFVALMVVGAACASNSGGRPPERVVPRARAAPAARGDPHRAAGRKARRHAGNGRRARRRRQHKEAGGAASSGGIRARQINTRGFTFDVLETGSAGEPVLLLHGFPDTSLEWTGLMPVLSANGYHCLAPDQRGYSPGARPTEVDAYTV